MLVDLMVKIMKKHIRSESQSCLCLELRSLNTFVFCVHKNKLAGFVVFSTQIVTRNMNDQPFLITLCYFE